MAQAFPPINPNPDFNQVQTYVFYDFESNDPPKIYRRAPSIIRPAVDYYLDSLGLSGPRLYLGVVANLVENRITDRAYNSLWHSGFPIHSVDLVGRKQVADDFICERFEDIRLHIEHSGTRVNVVLMSADKGYYDWLVFFNNCSNVQVILVFKEDKSSGDIKKFPCTRIGWNTMLQRYISSRNPNPQPHLPLPPPPPRVYPRWPPHKPTPPPYSPPKPPPPNPPPAQGQGHGRGGGRHARSGPAGSNIALRFGEGDEESMSRPFGVSLLIAGHDENGPSLYYTDRSGTFWQCNAKASGLGSEGADSSLQEQFNKVLEAFSVNFAVEKRITSPLLEPSSIEKIMETDDHIGCATSGLMADARTLVEHTRVETQNH